MKKSYYYGWSNLGIAALAMVGTLPGRTQGLGLITEPLLRDLQIDRLDYATLNLWATLTGAVFCLPCGRLTDRLGSRIVLTAVSIALGLSVLGMTWAGGLTALCIAVTLTRGFGQSALSVVSLALVGKWFSKRLNLAMGVYSLLVGIGFIAAFPAVGQAVIHAGWRTAWSGAGWAILCVLAPLSWLLTRDRPDDQREFMQENHNRDFQVSDATMWEALRSPAFWVFALSSSAFGLVYSGISLFNESILVKRGFGAETYHTVLVVSTMIGLAANFAAGYLASRWRIQRVMCIGMAVLALAVGALPLVTTFTHVMLYGLAMGTAGGVVTVVFFSAWGQVFGRAELGRIQGCAQTMTVCASAVGPVLLAWTLRATGSYDAIFHTLAAVTALLGVACWYVPMPVRSRLRALINSPEGA